MAQGGHTASLWHATPRSCRHSMLMVNHGQGLISLMRLPSSAQEWKRHRYPELVNSDACRLVVLACETGGRWSSTCRALVRDLASAKARDAPEVLRGSLFYGWVSRWWALLSMAQQTALAASLSEEHMGVLHGTAADEPPLADVLLDTPIIGPSLVC